MNDIAYHELDRDIRDMSLRLRQFAKKESRDSIRQKANVAAAKLDQLSPILELKILQTLEKDLNEKGTRDAYEVTNSQV